LRLFHAARMRRPAAPVNSSEGQNAPGQMA
jgi:hypothetical protein